MVNKNHESTPDTPQAKGIDEPPINALKPSEKLDRRIGPIRWVKETRQALEADFEGSARAILTHIISVNLSLQRVIMDHAMAHPDELVKDGQLHPLLALDLSRLQASTRATLAELRRYEDKPPSGGKGKNSRRHGATVAELVLNANDGD